MRRKVIGAVQMTSNGSNSFSAFSDDSAVS
jgi:hypothetical protein